MNITKGDVTRLGSRRDGKAYNFALASEKACITLCIYDGARKLKERIQLDESFKTGNVFACKISDISLEKAYYVYESEGDIYVDPYAKTVTDCSEFGVKGSNPQYLSRVVLDEYNWEGDSPLNLPYNDCII